MENITLIGGREKRFLEEAREIATKNGYWRGWPPEALAAYCERRDSDNKAHCVYCNRELQEFDWTVDHLLPKGLDRYPELDWTKRGSISAWWKRTDAEGLLTGNAVPCCHACNSAKVRIDPNYIEDGAFVYQRDRHEGALNPTQREKLIARASKVVQERLARRRSRIEAL